MPIKDFPFICLDADNFQRPWLPIRITNPHTKLFFDTIGLLDTGADECSIPGHIGEEIGHDIAIVGSKPIRTAGGVITAYPHITQIQIFDIRQKKFVYTIQDTPIDYINELHCVLLGVKKFLDRFILRIDYPQFYFSIKSP